MSSEKTTNLGMHRWAGRDPVKRTEFNENFGIIDKTLKLYSDALGLLSSNYQTLQEAINDAITKGEQLVISGQHTLNSRLLINAPITIVLSNNTFFTQTEFAYPIFEVRSAGVKFYGKLRAENTGVAYHITPTEITNRGLSVPVEVASDPKAYSAVIACIQNVDDLYVEHVEGKNFVTTMSFLSNVSTDTNYSSDVKVDYSYGEKQWQTVVGGGFKSASFGVIEGKNMVKSQGENPEHVLYIGTRPNAPDWFIYVNRIIGRDSPNMSYIAQVKTVKEFVCDEVVGNNCSHSLHVGEGCPNARIGSVKGVYVPNTVYKDHVLKVAGGSICSVDTVDLVTSETHDSVSLGAAIGASGTGTQLEIKNVILKMTAASNPIKAVRSSSNIKIHRLSIEYLVAPSAQPILCEAGSLYIYNPPIVKGSGNLVFQGINAVDYHLAFDPNLISGEMDDTTISMNNNDFTKLHFKGFDKTPIEQTPTTGMTSFNLRARNILKLKKGTETINTLARGAEMQEYLLIAGSDGTSPPLAQSSGGIGNLFFKNGTGYAADSWKAIKLICVGGNFYEV